jgi:hypothetical protein
MRFFFGLEASNLVKASVMNAVVRFERMWIEYIMRAGKSLLRFPDVLRILTYDLFQMLKSQFVQFTRGPKVS